VNAGTLTLDTAGSLASPSITVASAATMNVNGSLLNSANLTTSGTLNFAGNTTSATATRNLGALSINTGGLATILPSTFPFTPEILHPFIANFADVSAKLDLTNNELVAPGSASTAQSLIALGQVFSSSTGGALGYIDAGGGNFEIRWTLFGDTDLDGRVNVSDLGNLATNFGLTTAATWVQGDFDYNGTVNVADLGDLATNFGQTLAGGAATAATTVSATMTAIDSGEFTRADFGELSRAVPEPGGLWLMGLFTAGGVARIRRSRLHRV